MRTPLVLPTAYPDATVAAPASRYGLAGALIRNRPAADTGAFALIARLLTLWRPAVAAFWVGDPFHIGGLIAPFFRVRSW